MVAKIQAWNIVSTPAPTLVPKLFATSFAPMPKARINATIKPTTTIHIKLSSYGILIFTWLKSILLELSRCVWRICVCVCVCICISIVFLLLLVRIRQKIGRHDQLMILFYYHYHYHHNHYCTITSCSVAPVKQLIQYRLRGSCIKEEPSGTERYINTWCKRLSIRIYPFYIHLNECIYIFFHNIICIYIFIVALIRSIL